MKDITDDFGGVDVPPALIPAARYMRRRGIGGYGLDAAICFIATTGSASLCPQLILESDQAAVEALLPEAPAWRSRLWDRVTSELAGGGA